MKLNILLAYYILQFNKLIFSFDIYIYYLIIKITKINYIIFGKIIKKDKQNKFVKKSIIKNYFIKVLLYLLAITKFSNK